MIRSLRESSCDGFIVIHKTNLSQSMANKVLMIPAGHLFIRQWRNGDRDVFLLESLLQPVEMFVPPTDLDRIEWRCQLICDVWFQSFQFGFFLGWGQETGVGMLIRGPLEATETFFRHKDLTIGRNGFILGTQNVIFSSWLDECWKSVVGFRHLDWFLWGRNSVSADSGRSRDVKHGIGDWIIILASARRIKGIWGILWRLWIIIIPVIFIPSAIPAQVTVSGVAAPDNMIIWSGSIWFDVSFGKQAGFSPGIGSLPPSVADILSIDSQDVSVDVTLRGIVCQLIYQRPIQRMMTHPETMDNSPDPGWALKSYNALTCILIKEWSTDYYCDPLWRNTSVNCGSCSRCSSGRDDDSPLIQMKRLIRILDVLLDDNRQ